MNDFQGHARETGRVAIIVSRYNELVTRRLLEGARTCCREAGLADDRVDVVWVAGAFELPVACAAAAGTGRYACLVALGAVVRGETPHFDFVAAEATRGLGQVALEHRLPVGFGLLTVDTMAQALDRAGGAAGNKGHDAAAAALATSDAIARLRDGRHAAE